MAAPAQVQDRRDMQDMSHKRMRLRVLACADSYVTCWPNIKGLLASGHPKTDTGHQGRLTCSTATAYKEADILCAGNLSTAQIGHLTAVPMLDANLCTQVGSQSACLMGSGPRYALACMALSGV